MVYLFTSDGVLEGCVQFEDYFFDEIAEIFIVDSSHIADPPMSVGFPFLPERKG
jgi:hypothetical protein